jgi:succinate-semialdehyde dehydrogenase/glutarate-semialdehyde dehydrogenase
MVFGDPAEVATQLVRSPHTQAVSFTGSTRIGQEIARLASDGVKRLTLELGGHAPVVVFSDADVEETVALAVVSKFERNAGQVCISPSRFFVEAPRYAEFVDRFVAAVEDLKVGDGFDPSVDMGPLANPRRLTAMTGLVEDAAARGATIAVGGGAPEREGFFFSPTVVLDPPPEARVMREEPFGPLATITPVADRDEAITRANELPFGLAAYGFTRSMETAHRFFTGIEAGIVGLNSFDVSDAETPFGGMKLSGYGSEGGIEGIRECLVTKYIYRRWSPPDAL